MESIEGVTGAVGQHVGGGGLEGGAEVGNVLVFEGSRRQGVDGLANGGLQAGEGKMTPGPALQRPRQGEARPVPFGGPGLNGRSARIAQAQHLGGFIEGFPQGVVDGGAETPVTPDALDGQQLAMAAGNQQQQVGKIDAVGQPRRQGMPFQVIDGQERQLMNGGDRLGRHDADHDAADQAGAAGRRHGAEVLEFDPRRLHCLVDQPVDVLQV